MNPLDQKSETCTSECECATSVDTSSLTEDKNQSSVKSNAKSNDKEPSAEVVMAKSKGPWADKEHSAFLEGLEKYGIDWKQIATLVKSRNAEEVQRHFYSYQQEEPFLSTLIRMLDDKSLDHIITWQPDGRAFCIYNEKKCVRIALLLYYRSLFFQGIEHFERELHMYGFYKDIHGSVWCHPQFCRDSSLEFKDSAPAARKLEKKPNHNLISGSSRNAKRSRDQTRHSTSTSSKKRKARESTKQKSDELSIFTPEKDTALDGEAQNMMDSTNSLKPFHQTNTDFERNNEATCDELVQGSNELRDESNLLSPYSDKLNKGKWTDKEHRLFVEGLELYGIEDLKKIASHIKTRTNYQVRYYADKYFSSVGIMKTNTGEWSAEEHNRFLEGLEQHGRSWKHVASHVKTRTYAQVNGYGYHYLNKIECYWTTKEHQLFLEGLDQHGRGHWEEIATHVGTKYKEQVSFHAHEYFEKEEMNKESQKMTDGSDEHSPVARKLVKKPNHNLINVTSRNAKRSIDQAGDSTSTSSSKRITRVSIKQKNDKQRIVTTEKNTGLEGDMQRMIDSTNSLKSVYQKKTDLQNGNEATCNNLVQESKKLYDKSLLLPFNAHQDVQGITEKEEYQNAVIGSVKDASKKPWSIEESAQYAEVG
ncbi:hypothetical protein CTEN210_03589 [Chaetoceros tenuissimus]|uniref:Uncharacterized protein n=1 Tax=Chaetoceros tenuissimus TaxID=426638 RepID=A0AAD3CM03_9STRA|nr:hypothetical protein CTEN210_03589 [Chaetoceros tenuissimus]